MVSATLLLILIFIILKIVRVVYARKNFMIFAKECQEVAEMYLKERWSVSNSKRDKIIKSILTPTALKIASSESTDAIIENTSETITDQIPLFKIAKGIFNYYKKDEYVDYLKDRFMLFSQPLLKVEDYKSDVFSYAIIFLSVWGLVITASEKNADFLTITFYLMLVPILVSIYKLMNLMGLKYSENDVVKGIIIEDHKVKYIFTKTDEGRISVDVNNKIMKQQFTYESKYLS